jgi:hypothetical protein
VTRAVVVGGTGPVGDPVLAQLRALGVATVERVSGPTGVTTAVAVATKLAAVLAQSGLPTPDTALLASARSGSLADVATLGSVGAATNRPVLLVSGRGAPAATLAALRTLKITRAVVAAGSADVPTTALRTLAGAGVRSWTRAVGTGRAGTALVLARTLLPDAASTPPSARGDAWAGTPTDAGVTDVVAANAAGRPVLLLPAVVTSGIAAWLTSAKPAHTWVLGGTAQVPTPLFTALQQVGTTAVAR